LNSKTLVRGVVALLLCVGALARAEEPPPVLMDEQTVRQPRAEASRDPTAAATIVEASRFAGEAKDVAQLIATAPGVAVNDYGGLGQLSTVSIRGSMGNGVLVLLDGLKLDTGSGAATDLASIPRHWVSRVEVLRGAEGAWVGAGALGGAVEIATVPPSVGRWSAEAGAGSFSTFSAGADAALLLGPWTVMGAASVDATGGDFTYLFDPQPGVPGTPLVAQTRANNGALRGGALVKGSRPVGDWRLDALAQLSGGHRNLAGSPYALTPWAWQDDARALASARLAGPTAHPDVDAALSLVARADRLEGRFNQFGPPDPQRGLGLEAGGEVTLRHGAGRLRGLLSVGGEQLASDGLGGARRRLSLGAGVTEDASLLGGRLRLAPALRFDRVGTFDGWSAKLGGRWSLGETLALRGSVGRTFRAPGFAELYLVQGMVSPNPGLKPETTIGGDAALVADGSAGLASLGLFLQRYDDLIVYQRTSFNQVKPFNDLRALASGLEFELASAPWHAAWDMAAALSYTLLATENLEAPAGALGKQLAYRARHRLYARLSAAPGPVEFHAECHHVSLRYQDAANTAAQAIPPTLLFNAGVSLRLATRPALRIHLDVKNLADQRTLLDQVGNPLPGRMVMITLRAGSSTDGAP
jgi:outer membrane cobalamin receptor